MEEQETEYSTEGVRTDKQRVDIYYENNGVRHRLPIMVRMDPRRQTIEEGIVHILGGSQGKTFEQVAVERGWNEAYWMYPSGVVAHGEEETA